jgi:hypothetical protein
MNAAFASGVMFMTIYKEESPMPSVTSQDGTNIAFDRVGSGLDVILASGATAYRACTAPTFPYTKHTFESELPQQRGST